jgi:hypothetical protein
MQVQKKREREREGEKERERGAWKKVCAQANETETN